MLPYGSTSQILIVLARTAVGVWLVSIAVRVYFGGPLGAGMRAGLLAAGLALLLPHALFADAAWMNVAGALAAVLFVGIRFTRRRTRLTP